MRKIFFILFSILNLEAYSQTDTLGLRKGVFELGEIQVTGIKKAPASDAISSTRMEQLNKTDVAAALNTLPGISVASVGARNESVVYVRGFDLRQVPVFIDGIPVYIPYDGYVDLGRFTTFDLSEINVSKGFSSITYGPNTMGGAINLVSRKPVEKLEINGRVGAFSGQGHRWNLNAGSNLGKFFFQAGVSQLKRNHYPLSSSFVLKGYQMEYERNNAYTDDRKINLKAGFTPNERHEIVIGYVNQAGEKGNPPYLGTDPDIKVRFWQWPKRDKESIYLLSNSSLGSHFKLKTRWYYDTFVNELVSYDDATYTSSTKPYAFTSFYDDFTLGGNIELESRRFNNNVSRLSVQMKNDVHRENNLGEPRRDFIDNTVSIGAEHSYTSSSFTFIPGISFNLRNSEKAEDYNDKTDEIIDFPSNTNAAVNAQLGVFYDLHEDHSLSASIARKTRFATLKDRYSYRMGKAIPNPDLHAEVALNYDLSYSGKFFKDLSIQLSAYRSDITAIIQRVDNVAPDRYQLQNAGDALFYGFEASADYRLTHALVVGSNYTFIQRKNETYPELLFTDVPEHQIFGYMDISFLTRANLLFSVERNSERYSTSYGTRIDGYTLTNVGAGLKINQYLALEGGANNIFDKNYQLIDGYPEAGRNFFVNLVFRNF